MKKLMTFFALISIIILAIPINCYSWGPGTDRGTILAKSDPFRDYYLANYPSSRGPLFNEYGLPRNIPTGVLQAYNYAQHYGWNQPYNYSRNQPFYVPSFNNYNYFSPGQPFFNAFGSQDSPYQAEAGNYGNFKFTTYADYIPSNIMNMPPVTSGAKYIATPHAIIWSNVSYPNGIPEGPFGTIFGNDPFGDDDDD